MSITRHGNDLLEYRTMHLDGHSPAGLQSILDEGPERDRRALRGSHRQVRREVGQVVVHKQADGTGGSVEELPRISVAGASSSGRGCHQQASAASGASPLSSSSPAPGVEAGVLSSRQAGDLEEGAVAPGGGRTFRPISRGVAKSKKKSCGDDRWCSPLQPPASSLGRRCRTTVQARCRICTRFRANAVAAFELRKWSVQRPGSGCRQWFFRTRQAAEAPLLDVPGGASRRRGYSAPTAGQRPTQPSQGLEASPPCRHQMPMPPRKVGTRLLARRPGRTPTM